MLAGDCENDNASMSGVLEILGDAGEIQSSHYILETIVNHINGHEEVGSVIIIPHIESMPIQIIRDVSYVLSGKYHSLSYQTRECKFVEASCNGSVFILTSRLFGVKTIFQIINENNGLHRLSSESLITSIRRNVDENSFGLLIPACMTECYMIFVQSTNFQSLVVLPYSYLI